MTSIFMEMEFALSVPVVVALTRLVGVVSLAFTAKEIASSRKIDSVCRFDFPFHQENIAAPAETSTVNRAIQFFMLIASLA